MSVQHHSPPAPTAARLLGLLVFVAGVGLLFFVFLAAKSLFDAPPPAIPTPSPAAATGTNSAAPSAVAEIGVAFSQLLRRILLLLLMCIAGSVIASKGIQLFFAAQGSPEPAPTAQKKAPASPTKPDAP